MDDYIKIFSNIKIVKGVRFGLVIDYQNKKYFRVERNIFDLILKFDGVKIKNIYNINRSYDKGSIDKLLKILVKQNLIFITKIPNQFPPIDMNYFWPSQISNAIIDVNFKHIEFYKDVFDDLTDLGCEFMKLRIFHELNFKLVENILNLLDKSSVINCTIEISKINPSKISKLDNLFNSFHILKQIVIFNFREDIKINPRIENGELILRSEEVNSHTSCGVVSENIFLSNINFLSEGLKFNTCLNRKVGIDFNGEIKNCPSMRKSHGNIQNIRIKEICISNDFIELWSITKDKISVCKDCEFRYVCTDCRAFIEDPEDYFSKPLKCGYNPYIGQWSEWSTNPLKKKAIEFYKL